MNILAIAPHSQQLDAIENLIKPLKLKLKKENKRRRVNKSKSNICIGY